MSLSVGNKRCYIAIDLKSFYASVECVERGLDPLGVNLVVADNSRTEKTICLAVSPSMKAYGIPGRPRLFEVVKNIYDLNNRRKRYCKDGMFEGKSYFADELRENPCFEIDYIIAKPRMAHYIEYSTRIYNIYLKYVAPEDIHIYSIDEVFIDATSYLHLYNMKASEMAKKIIKDILEETKITATAGIGTNLYLAKIAMDIVAKHTKPDEDGVCVAEIDEISYRKKLWDHRPLRDFWRVGKGYTKKLEAIGIYTMGDIARMSLENEDILYNMFGKNAELLIDHAWGYEPCKMSDIKEYKPYVNSLSSGQVLHNPYEFSKARLVATEMAESLVLDIYEKKLVTDQIVITVGYDIENLTRPEIAQYYKGEVKVDSYGRRVPKHAHGTINLDEYTSSIGEIVSAAQDLFDKIVDPMLLIRRITIVFGRVIPEDKVVKKVIQSNFFDVLFESEENLEKKKRKEDKLKKEKKIQEALLNIKTKHGKNAVLKGYNLEEGATAKERNSQIGGHKA